MHVVRWHNESQGVIYWSIDNNQTVDDLLSNCDYFSLLVAAHSGPLYPVLDFTNLHRMDADIVRQFPRMAERLPVGQGRAVFIAVVSQRIFIRTLISIFSRVFGDEYRHYPTLELALESIARHQGVETVLDVTPIL